MKIIQKYALTMALLIGGSQVTAAADSVVAAVAEPAQSAVLQSIPGLLTALIQARPSIVECAALLTFPVVAGIADWFNTKPHGQWQEINSLETEIGDLRWVHNQTDCKAKKTLIQQEIDKLKEKLAQINASTNWYKDVSNAIKKLAVPTALLVSGIAAINYGVKAGIVLRALITDVDNGVQCCDHASAASA
jgi:Tfp pilus assembly protein PilN